MEWRRNGVRSAQCHNCSTTALGTDCALHIPVLLPAHERMCVRARKHGLLSRYSCRHGWLHDCPAIARILQWCLACCSTLILCRRHFRVAGCWENMDDAMPAEPCWLDTGCAEGSSCHASHLSLAREGAAGGSVRLLEVSLSPPCLGHPSCPACPPQWNQALPQSTLMAVRQQSLITGVREDNN
jgi:hypothetical protein